MVIINWTSLILGLVIIGLGWINENFEAYGYGMVLAIVSLTLFTKDFLDWSDAWKAAEAKIFLLRQRAEKAEAEIQEAKKLPKVPVKIEEKAPAVAKESVPQEKKAEYKNAREFVYENLHWKLFREIQNYERIVEKRRKAERSSRLNKAIAADSRKTKAEVEKPAIATIQEIPVKDIVVEVKSEVQKKSAEKEVSLHHTQIQFIPKADSVDSVSDINDLARMVAKLPPSDGRALVLSSFNEKFDPSLLAERSLRYNHKIDCVTYYDVCTAVDLIPHVRFTADIDQEVMLKFLLDMQEYYQEIIIFMPQAHAKIWRPILRNFESRQEQKLVLPKKLITPSRAPEAQASL
jgi:hypothetical protein